MKDLLLLSLFAAFSFQSIFSQDNPDIKAGRISANDFTINSTVVDSNSNAVVIADIGSCRFVGNNKGWFTVVYTELKRMKILNRKGFSAAEVHIGLNKYGDNIEKITALKAVTYNLVNSSIVTAELDDKSLFEDEISKNYIEKKFTFPAVREGSIIEYSYKVESDFLFHLPPWRFQGEYPILWSSYEISVPVLFNYIIKQQGSLNFFIDKTRQKTEVFRVRQGPKDMYTGQEEFYAVTSNVVTKNWVMKAVPAMQVQDYTSSTENYISKLEFQLSEYRMPDEPVESKMKDWNMVGSELLKDADFGRPIMDDDPWVADEIRNMQLDGLSDDQKARNIFAYVRDDYTCTRQHGIFLSEHTRLKDVIKQRNGSVSDLNLLLIAMLRKARLEADPVILSTRAYGLVDPDYPMLQKFNYLICQLKLSNVLYYLDASDHYLGFGKLLPKCYNGQSQLISNQPKVIELNTDDLAENESSNISLVNGPSGMTGTFRALLGDNTSLLVRKKVHDDKEKNYFEEETKKYTEDVTITNGRFDSLKNYDYPVTVIYDVDVKLKKDSLIYFSPMLAKQMRGNPFKAQNRLYPVELPYVINSIYSLTMEIPTGYKVEELPRSQAFSLPDHKGRFDYEIMQVANQIQLRCRLQMNKTFFAVDEYEKIRALFDQVINKENEQIVFRKVN